jgi:hypothetical protein
LAASHGMAGLFEIPCDPRLTVPTF